MTHTKIVAFFGYKGSGKDTAAGLLSNHLNKLDRSCYLHNFAAPVKMFVAQLYGLTRDECYEPALKEKVLGRWPYKSPRFLMQEFAEQMCRSRYPDIWVRQWVMNFPETDSENNTYDYVLVTDLRYPNEYEELRRRGAVIVSVHRPGLDLSDQHESESHYGKFTPDVILHNTGTIEYLSEAVELDLLDDVLRSK